MAETVGMADFDTNRSGNLLFVILFDTFWGKIKRKKKIEKQMHVIILEIRPVM